jgi:cell shape-determining protein MreC
MVGKMLKKSKKSNLRREKMGKKLIIAVIAVAVLGSVSIYSQSSSYCENQANNAKTAYEGCVKSLLDDVTKVLLPLLAQKKSLEDRKKQLEDMLKNHETVKANLTKSIEDLTAQIKTKGCTNCSELINSSGSTTSNNNNTSNTGSNSSGTLTKPGSCKLPNICTVCSSLIDQSSGKNLCEVCGCK